MHLQILTPSPTTVEFTVSTRSASTRRALVLLLSACCRTAVIVLAMAAALRRVFPNAVPWGWAVAVEEWAWRRWDAGIGVGMGVCAAVLAVVALLGIGGCGKEESLLLIRHLGIQTSTSTISPLPISFWPPSLSLRPSTPVPPNHHSGVLTITKSTSIDIADETSSSSTITAFFCRFLRGFASTRRTRFIPTSLVQDIFIHEGFRGFEVKFYLVVVVRGEEDVVVVFPDTLPKRKVLEQVWRGARSCLFGADAEETVVNGAHNCKDGDGTAERKS